MNYEFTQTWTKEDYVAFATNHLLNNFKKIQNLLLYSISIGYLLITPTLTGKFTFFYVGIALLVIIALYIVFARHTAAKGYEKNKEYLTISFELNQASLTYITKEGKLTEPWQNFYSVKETKDYFFIYFTAQKGFLLAKRDLTDSMKSFVIRMFQEHMTNKKHMKFLKK